MSGIFYMEEIIKRVKAGEIIKVRNIIRKRGGEHGYIIMEPDKGEEDIRLIDCSIKVSPTFKDDFFISFKRTNNKDMASRRHKDKEEGYDYGFRTSEQTLKCLYFAEQKPREVRKIGKYKIIRNEQ